MARLQRAPQGAIDLTKGRSIPTLCSRLAALVAGEPLAVPVKRLNDSFTVLRILTLRRFSGQPTETESVSNNCQAQVFDG